MKVLLFIVCVSICPPIVLSQTIGVGTTTPNPAAALDISSTTGGLLVPRMSIGQRDAIASPAKGLIVFIVTDSSLYYYDGSWKRLVPALETWNLQGNSQTNNTIHFIGTTDSVRLSVKVNNQLSGKIGFNYEDCSWGYKALSISTGYGNTAVGGNALRINTSGFENVGIGGNALFGNTTGIGNVSIGAQSMMLNTTGAANVAVGRAALYGNSIGIGNVALGQGAMYNNFNGSFNTAVGNGALEYNVLGTYNTAIGYFANAGLTNSTAIGSYAVADESNQVVLGDQNVTKVQTSGTVIASGFASGMTTLQIQALVLPREGTIIYNSTSKKPVYFDGTVWRYFNDTAM